jgi:hypothetical protein
MTNLERIKEKKSEKRDRRLVVTSTFNYCQKKKNQHSIIFVVFKTVYKQISIYIDLL